MRLVRLALLIVVWLALWSDLSAANVLSGIVVGGAVVATFDTWHHGTLVVRPLHALRFALYFIRSLVMASFVVARTVVRPGHRVSTGIVAVPLQGCPDALVVLIADVISLTPGTLTLEVRRDPVTLFVHALDVRDVEQVQADVRRFEILAVRAFGPAEAVALLDVDETESWRSP